MTQGAARTRRRLSRAARIRRTIGATVVGLAALTAAAVLVERSRDTDLVDERVGVTSRFRAAIPDDAPPLRFTEVAAEMGIRVVHGDAPRRRNLIEDTGSGLAWGDLDGDGDDDLFFVDLARSAGGRGNRLLRNDGDRFTDVTDAAGIADPDGMGMGVSLVDYDADGDLDVYVTNAGANRLFQNAGDGTFRDVAAEAGVADPTWSVGAAWGDFDGDGRIDLYVCDYVDYPDAGPGAEMYAGEAGGGYVAPPALNPKVFAPLPNRLFRNRGDGTFEDVAAALGVDDPTGRSLGATFADLDGDGRLDLYVNNDVSTNRLFRNVSTPGAPAFEDISTQTGTADPRGSMGLSVGDVSGAAAAAGGGPDGRADLFITHWIAQENALYEGFVSATGALVYRDKARALRLAEIATAMVGWGSAFVDLDRDGRTDVVVANGSTLEDESDLTRLRPQPLFLLWNGGRHFYDLAPAAGPALAQPWGARGLAASDFDHDGDVDIAVSVNRGPLLLLRNDTEGTNRSLAITLDAPAAAVFGAVITVRCDDRVQRVYAGSDVSYASQHSSRHVFGLGAAERADEVTVRFTDGREARLSDVPAGDIVVAPPDEH